MKATWILALATFACVPREVERPFGDSFRLSVGDPADIEPSSPLRYAVVWVTHGPGTEGGFTVTDDGPVGLSGGGATVPLRLPSRGVVERLDPQEAVTLTSTVQARAHRPRIVVYEDRNEDERFDPGVLGGSGADAVLAIDQFSGPSALLDLDRVLRSLTISETERFYERNGGRYSPFVWTIASSIGRVIADPPGTFWLYLQESATAEVDLGCRRQVFSGSIGAALPAFGVETTATVDTSVDATAVCGTQLTDCRAADLAAMNAPDLTPDETGDARRLLQCRANDSLEFLLVTELGVECEECRCEPTSRADLYVAAPAAKPAWWPCGATVPYCTSALPAHAFDVDCYNALQDGDAGSDAADGGTDSG